MNFECSFSGVDLIEVCYTRQFVWHITFPIIGGFMFGYNTGVISGALIKLRQEFNLGTFWQEAIVSVAVFAAAVSSLTSGVLSNKFGRKKIIIVSCICFIIGSLITINKYLEYLVVGRAIVGIGVGLSSSCCPVYIAEITPRVIRGRIIALYQVSITMGMFFAALIDASFYYKGWRYMLGFAAIPAVIELIGMLTLSESYRWLLSKNRIQEAEKIIQKLNQIPKQNIDEYIYDILHSNEIIEREVQEHRLHYKSFVYQIYKDKIARQSLILGCSLQMLSQIVGINTIMYYTALVIQMSGVENEYTTLWLSALVAFFNFMPSFLGFILIDKIGRRKLTIISLLGIFFSLVILATTFQVVAVRSDKVTMIDPSINSTVEVKCSKKTTCEDCITSLRCGFCYINNKNSTCLASLENYDKYSINGWCAEKSSTAAVWQFDFCRSKYSWIVVVGMIFYIISFTIGMGPIPWTVTSEIYPIWCRSINMSLSTTVNWIFNLLISLTFLSLTRAITKYGTFWLYSSFTLCGVVFIYKYLPETNQKTLEEMPEIFS